MIKKLMGLRHLRIAGFAVGAVAVTGAAVLVTASAAGYQVPLFRSSAPSTPAAAASYPQSGKVSAACNDFITRFSADLNTSPSNFNAAFQKAVGQTLADEVKSGALTQAQADALQKKIAGRAPCALAAGLGTSPGAGATPRLAAYQQALINAAASALGVTAQQLQTELGQGMTLSQIAAQQKPPVTEDQFRTRLIASLTPLLDGAVAAKQLTGAQEKAILKRLQSGPIPFWNTALHAGKTAVPAGPTTITS